MEETRRPDPEQILEQIRAGEARTQKKERGRLKIFLGFAAGTGKTYAMLEAAQDLKRHGVDVVAGYVEPHARPETSAMLEGLETLPFKMADYKGIRIREFDLDAALERRPRLLLVDELAHTNAPGSRHQKRYQDIEELLEHGINVYTTVNIQHLESLNDVVERITHIEVKERIPDRIFDEADQVKLVDIEAEELIERMQEGKIYQKPQAERALQNFFTRDKLIALREIALRRMADRVNHLAEEEKKVMGTGEFSAGEHVLTCISPSPTNAKVIRTAARLAYAFHADFTALYVENRKLQNADEKTKKRRDENMRLARTLGAKVVTVYGEDIARQIAEYAKIGNVTKLVLGRTNHRLFLGQKRGTMLDGINQYAPNLDIYVIPDLKNKEEHRKYQPDRSAVTKFIGKPDGGDVVVMAAILAVCTLAGFGLWELGLTEADIIMVYLLGVMATAALTRGYISSVLASICSVLLFNCFFTAPRFSLKVYGRNYPVTFVMMLLVGLLSSYIMTKVQKQSEENAKRAYRTDILLTNSRKLRRAYTQEAVGNEIATQIQKLLNLTVIVYLKEDGRIRHPKVYLRRGIDETRQDELKMDYTVRSEQAVAAWVFGNGHRAGCTTHTLPDAQAIYLPVMAEETVTAVVGIVLEEKREIDPFEYDIIMVMLGEAALVLERIWRIEELGQTKK
jgi:two-component system sensor histidine kinase KdpD